MNLREYIENLNEFVKKNPEALDKRVVYSKDDEGNGFGDYFFAPTKARFEGQEDGYYAEPNGGEYDSVIIN